SAPSIRRCSITIVTWPAGPTHSIAPRSRRRSPSSKASAAPPPRTPASRRAGGIRSSRWNHRPASRARRRTPGSAGGSGRRGAVGRSRGDRPLGGADTQFGIVVSAARPRRQEFLLTRALPLTALLLLAVSACPRDQNAVLLITVKGGGSPPAVAALDVTIRSD